MAQFGGYEFTGFSVPLVFEGRYFIMEPGYPPLITVVMEADGKPVFEILKNQPSMNNFTDTSTNPAGIVTVSEKTSGKFLYKVLPNSETSVTFAKPDGGECTAVITDTEIRLGGLIVNNDLFHGSMAGVVVDPEIGVGMIGAPISPQVEQWLS
ncbi:MAG: hypothetical protein ACR2RD_15045 [Woeseiaceae bacterium]